MFEGWKLEDWEKELRIRGRLGPTMGRSSAWVVQASARLSKKIVVWEVIGWVTVM